MKYKNTFGEKAVILSIFLALLFLPVQFQLTQRNNETPATLTQLVSQVGVGLSIADAHCGTTCKLKRKIRRIWSNFLSTRGASVGSGPEFGGTIAATIMCHNGVIAFTQLPVAGLGGPYGVRPASGDLYREYSVVPGNWELGNAPGSDVCVICLSFVCLSFPVIKVTDPGMGTS